MISTKYDVMYIHGVCDVGPRTLLSGENSLSVIQKNGSTTCATQVAQVEVNENGKNNQSG